MEKEIVGSMEFLDAIVEDAKAMGSSILNEVQATIEQKLSSADEEIKSIKFDYEQKLKQEQDKIKQATLNAIKMEQKRVELSIGDALIDESIKSALSQLEKIAQTQAYAPIIMRLIKEAVYGIGSSPLYLQISKYEKPYITSDFLSQLCKQIKTESGVDVVITLEEELNAKQGVVLKDESKRVIFDNRFETRLIRYQSEIRQAIQSQ